MKRLFPLVGACLLGVGVSSHIASLAAGPDKVTKDFEADAVGSPPEGFEFARTGGSEGKWMVRVEKGGVTNRVLVQEGTDPTDDRFPLAVLKDGLYKDVTMTVRARPLSGKVDQGFGVVWRYKDARNYYIARCNALEDNCTIYHTVDGIRQAFQNHGVKVATNAWHTLKIDAVADHFTIWFDGSKVLNAKDETFKDAGKVGLWTKADSVIEFDDLAVEAAAPVLQTVADVPLPGPAVRFDYQGLDQAADRLYIAHMNADKLVVFDVKTRKVVANLQGFERVHGVIAVPALGRVYATVTGRHHVAVVDSRTLAVVARVGEIVYPDGLAYAPDVQRVFVSDEHGAADVVIDAKTHQQLSVIPLGGEAGNTVYDSRARRILVAVHGKNELVSIDPVTAKIVARTPLPGVENPHGIALDVEGRLAFVAGEANGTLAVVDLETLRVVETHKVADGPDVLAFDPGWRRLYVASESGGVNVFTEADPRNPAGKQLIRDGDISMPHAHTVAVDPRTHLVYFPLENIDGQAILRIMSSKVPTAPLR
jgi:DNA-binding beta-propeller fold protein YncE